MLWQNMLSYICSEKRKCRLQKLRRILNNVRKYTYLNIQIIPKSIKYFQQDMFQ